MNRTVAGMVTLTVAVFTIVIMSALVAPPRSGTATRSTPPAPPAVGTCAVLRGSELIVIDCAEPHTVEVASTWAADAPDAGPRPSYALCADKARDYVGSPPAQDPAAHEPGRWSLPLRYRPIVATGPDGSQLRDWSWQVCLVAPIGPAPFVGYQGQVKALSPGGTSSSALRSCYTEPEGALAVVPCNVPHVGEIVATQLMSPSQAKVAALATAMTTVTSCASAARILTGALDPTYRGQLRVTVLSDSVTRQPFGADTGVFYTAEGSNWLVCALESTNGRRLLSSVAGIGDGVLPFE